MWTDEVYVDGERHVTQQKTTETHGTADYGRETSELKIMVSAVRFCPSAPLLFTNKDGMFSIIPRSGHVTAKTRR